MGQYYKPISLDKKQWLYSHEYKYKAKGFNGEYFIASTGLKLMEHSYVGNKLLNAVENLLLPNGDWYKNRIVWAGDYADPEPNTIDKENPKGRNLYDIIGIDENKIKPKSTPIPKKYKYLCNHTKKEFVDYSKIKVDKDGYTINPLSLLTCEGNGEGGGDYDSEDNRIGTWARDIISIENIKPENYQEIDGTFIEK